MKIYTVFDRHNGQKIIENVSAQEAADACQIKLSTLYNAVTGQKTGNNTHWKIISKVSNKTSSHKKRPPAVKVKRERQRTPYVRYTVYNNYTDELVALDALAEDAAYAMGIQMATFYATITRSKSGVNKKWHVEEKRGEK